MEPVAESRLSFRGRRTAGVGDRKIHCFSVSNIRIPGPGIVDHFGRVISFMAMVFPAPPPPPRHRHLKVLDS